VLWRQAVNKLLKILNSFNHDSARTLSDLIHDLSEFKSTPLAFNLAQNVWFWWLARFHCSWIKLKFRLGSKILENTQYPLFVSLSLWIIPANGQTLCCGTRCRS